MSRRLLGLPRRWFGLKRMALLLALLLLAPLPHHRSAHAQSTPEETPPGESIPGQTAPDTETGEGFSLMEEGAKLLLRGLLSEMEPTISEMDKAFRDLAPQIEALGPQIAEVARLMGDVRNYHMPEVLENGDILIRRRNAPEAGEVPPPDTAKPWPPAPGPDGQIDL